MIKIEKLYWEFFWSYFKTTHVIYLINDDRYKLNIIEKSQIEKINNNKEGVTNYIRNNIHSEGISNNKIKDSESFENVCGSIVGKINGLEEETYDKFLVIFYQHTKKSDKSKALKLIQKVYQTKNLAFIKVATIFFKNSTVLEFEQWWLSLPPNFCKLSQFKNPLEDIFLFLNMNVEKEKIHNFLYDFLIKRSKIINKNENIKIKLRDLLIEQFKSNEMCLENYKVYFPILELYLQTNENSDYLENRFVQESFYIEVNFEILKACIAIPGWNNKSYKSWINLLMDIIYKKNDEIHIIRKFSEKEPYKKHEYLSIYIAKHTNTGIKKEEIQEYIRSFFIMLKRDHAAIGNFIESKLSYADKWYQMESLNKNLKYNNRFKKVVKI